MEDERQLPGYDSGLPEDHSSDEEEETVAAEIEDLLRQGYSASQVVNEFGYARSSVNRIAKRFKKGKQSRAAIANYQQRYRQNS